MTQRWTFTIDSDPRLDELRRQPLARSTRSADTEPLGAANFEIRAVSPPIDLRASLLHDFQAVIRAFLAELGPEFRVLPSPAGWWAPNLVSLNQAELDLWGTLVAGAPVSSRAAPK
jgi:hypothetical protein